MFFVFDDENFYDSWSEVLTGCEEVTLNCGKIYI